MVLCVVVVVLDGVVIMVVVVKGLIMLFRSPTRTVRFLTTFSTWVLLVGSLDPSISITIYSIPNFVTMKRLSDYLFLTLNY